jgi:DNA-directed RNA polymerase II subunit RPB1
MSHFAPLSSSAVISDQVPVGRGEVMPRVVGFRLGLMSAADVKRVSAKTITDHAVYARNLPKLDGPNDPALGPSDRRVQCTLCSNDWFRCPGHNGDVELPVPVYHVGFADYVYKLLQALCWNCSAVLGDKTDPRLARHSRSRGMALFTQVAVMGRGRFSCAQCGMYQPKYSKTGMVIQRTWTQKKLEAIDEASPELGRSARRLFTPADALEILQGMSEEDILLMGMDPQKAHPASMIMQNMAVLPPNARPAIMALEGSKRRGQDDITNQTQDIVKTCKALRTAIAASGLPSGRKRGGGGNASEGNACTAAGAKKRKAAGGGAGPGAGAGKGGAQAQAQGGEGEDVIPTLPSELDLDPQRAQLTEHRVLAGSARSPVLTEDAVIAMRFAHINDYFSVTAEQASAIWSEHPALCEKLQNEVTVLYDNAGRVAPQSQQRSGAPKRSLMTRLVGKTGQIRGAAVAKRCDLNARTVIAPDNSLDVDEVGVPSQFMNHLTMLEEVNPRNLEALTKAVKAGPEVEEGAARILHVSGHLTQLSMLRPGEAPPVLQPGDIVERHLRDGDRCLLNRQPSLHRLSLLAPRIKRVPGLALRLSLGLTGVFNADFDGDEMNLHAVQGLSANAEVAELIAVSRNVMNPQNNAPCLNIVQDARVGAMLLTARHTRVGLDTMHQCLGARRYPVEGKEGLPSPAGVDPETGDPYWTGKQLVTLLLPPIFLERRVRGAGPEVGPDDPFERYVLIQNGVLLHGTLCKATLTGTGSIIHKICTDHGQDAVVRFISDFQRVMYAWLPTHGLSMGLRDCMVPPQVRDRIRECTDHADGVVATLSRELKDLEPYMTEMELACAETHILTILTSVLDYTSRLVLGADGNVPPGQNPEAPFGFRAMVLSASKGNSNNIAQVMACLGQQVIEGQRVPTTAQSKRTLPMFRPGAFSAAARGFIRRAYVDGMEPDEYFYHMMGGREGLVATAVKTAETGYKYRSMTKGMETNKTEWDLTVRNAQNHIIEFVAGGDAMDPTRVERVGLPPVAMGNARLAAALGGAAAVPPEYLARAIAVRDFVRAGVLTPFRSELNSRVLLPLNIADELIRAAFINGDAKERRRRTGFGANANANGDGHVGTGPDADPDPDADSDHDLARAVLALTDDLAGLVPSREVMAALELSVLYECRPGALRRAGIHTVAGFVHSLGRLIRGRMEGALAHPGESVGVLAGQSIGEPATQFTLNVFHSAGLMQRLLTVGVPRLKELLHGSERIRTPSMLVPFRGALTMDQMRACAASLQFLCIDSVLHTSYPQLDPAGDGVTTPVTTMSKDFALMSHVAAVYGPEAGARLSPWILRLVLNRTVLMEHQFTPERVARLIATQMTEYTLSIVYSQPNMPTWVIRIRIDGDESEAGCRRLHAELRETILLGGIDTVRQSRVIMVSRPVVDPDTGDVVTRQTPVIDTEGSGLMKVATRPWADWQGTVTNDVQEVNRTLGLAAARQALCSELELAMSYDGSYVDLRHIEEVVDTMTHRGYFMPYTRHGINRVDFSVIQRASYEEPVDMLLQGAMTAEYDGLKGLCECVVFGQKPPIGTGTVGIRSTLASSEDAGTFRPCVTSRELDLLPGNNKRFRDGGAAGGSRGYSAADLAAKQDLWKSSLGSDPTPVSVREEDWVAAPVDPRQALRAARRGATPADVVTTNALGAAVAAATVFAPCSPKRR